MSGWFRDGDLVIDLRACRVWLGGQEINLSALRFKILCYLTEKAGQPVTPRELLRYAWPDEQYDAGLVRWHISRLRQDLNDAPPKRIVHVRGFGYRYDRETPEETDLMPRRVHVNGGESHKPRRIRRMQSHSCKSRISPKVPSGFGSPVLNVNGVASRQLDLID